MSSQQHVYYKALEIGQPDAHTLRIVIGEALPGPEVSAVIEGLDISGRDLDVAPDSRVFEIVWDDFAQYTMTLESYALPEGEEPVVTNDVVREYKDSRYLRQVRESTFAEFVRGPLRHWGVYCLDHCVDVAGWRDPRVKELFGYVAGSRTDATTRH